MTKKTDKSSTDVSEFIENPANKNVLMQAFLRNSYGGGYGKKQETSKKATKREMPIVTTDAGIKMEWDNNCDAYPTTITLKMTNGKWVRYMLDIRLPSLQTGITKVPTCGYPRKEP